MTMLLPAYGKLVVFALDRLWADSDFQHPEEWGCCHVCCAACAALDELDMAYVLDYAARQGEHRPTSGWWEIDRLGMAVVNRVWLYRQWMGSPIQKQCGHAYLPPESLKEKIAATRGQMPVGAENKLGG